MKENKKQSEENKMPDYTELGAKESAGIYPNPVRPYYLKVKEGPGVIIPKGSYVRLTNATAFMLLAAKKIILGIGEQEYEVTRQFPYINDEGLCRTVTPGTHVLLSEEEAISRLIRSEVKPCFELPLFQKDGRQS